jgi:hypothetical protein
MIDIALAKEVVAHAKGHPVCEAESAADWPNFQHDQHVFYDVKLMPEGACKTRACLAGIAVLLSPNAGVRGEKYTEWAPTIQGCPEDDYDEDGWADAAMHLLGLTHVQATEIFFTMDGLAAIHKLELLIREAESVRANS